MNNSLEKYILYRCRLMLGDTHLIWAVLVLLQLGRNIVARHCKRFITTFLAKDERKWASCFIASSISSRILSEVRLGACLCTEEIHNTDRKVETRLADKWIC